MPCTMGCIMLSGMGRLDLGALRHGLYMNFQRLRTFGGDKRSGGRLHKHIDCTKSLKILSCKNLF